MASPTRLKSLSIKLDTGTQLDAYVRVRNLTTGDYQIRRATSAGEVMFELNELSNDGTVDGTKTGASTGDVIEYQVQGANYGGGTYVISASTGRQKVELTTTNRSTTETVGVSI